MAGTCQASLLLVAVCLTGVGVRGVRGGCASMERCFTEFKDQVKRVHDRDNFCRLMKQRLECYNTALSACPHDLKLSAQRQIQSAQREQKGECGAGWIQASHWLMALSAMLAMLFHRHL